MNVNRIYSRAKNLILNPAKEWLIIKNENSNSRRLILEYAGPLITLGAITLFLKNIFSEYSFLGVLLTAIIYFVSMYGSMYFSSLIIAEIAKRLNIQTSKRIVFTLVIYSSFAFYLGRATANLHEQLSLFNLFSLYSVYLFWIGFDVYFENLQTKKPGFVVLSLLTIYLCYILLQYILAPLTNLTNNLSI